MKLITRVFFEGYEFGTLIIFLPGLRQKPINYSDLFQELQSATEFRNCTAIGIEYKSAWFSNQDPDELAVMVDSKIEELGSRFEKIILVGHSIGGLIARKALIVGSNSMRSWPAKVDRLLLLASANRGFAFRNIWTRLVLFVADLLDFLGLGYARLIRNARKQSDWINSLRIDWAKGFHDSPPDVFQIYGERDIYVENNDSVDLMHFHNSVEVKLPNLRHESFSDNSRSIEIAAELKHYFFDAMPEADEIEKTEPPLVVLLVHGIRDFAEWQESLTLSIKKLNPLAVVIPVQYGYFNAFQFLSPLQRWRAVRVFVDKYIQTRLLFPNAKIAVAAHSNGTYAVGNGVKQYSFIHIDRLYLCGSVLPRDFKWSSIRGNVDCVRNDIANQDWPVGVLCNAWRVMDHGIGVAGFKGFKCIEGQDITQNFYLDGPHAAALYPPYRDEVAEFLATGNPKTTRQESQRNRWFQAFSILALPLFVLLLIILFFAYWTFTIFGGLYAVGLAAAFTFLLLLGLSSI